jgi:hypothetical protein
VFIVNELFFFSEVILTGYLNRKDNVQPDLQS